MTAVLLVSDEHAMVSHALAVTLRSSGFPTIEVVETPASVAPFVKVTERLQPDLVVLGLDLFDVVGGVPVVTALVERGRSVLVLTSTEDHAGLGAALEAGAVGALGKYRPFCALKDSVDLAIAGRPLHQPRERAELLAALRARRAARQVTDAPFERLTPKEQVVLAGLILGRSVEKVASTEGVAVATIRSHVRGILSKLDVRSQLAAVAKATEAGWRPPHRSEAAPLPSRASAGRDSRIAYVSSRAALQQ